MRGHLSPRLMRRSQAPCRVSSPCPRSDVLGKRTQPSRLVLHRNESAILFRIGDRDRRETQRCRLTQLCFRRRQELLVEVPPLLRVPKGGQTTERDELICAVPLSVGLACLVSPRLSSPTNYTLIYNCSKQPEARS